MDNPAPADGLKPLSEPESRGGLLSRVLRAGRTTAVVAILTLLLLEIALRAMGLGSPVLYVDDEATGYRLRPEQNVRYLTNSIIVNGWGVRDSRPFEAKEPNKTRILVLGDSVTWGGIRIGQEDLFTSVLERSLAGTEVINAGVNGYSVGQMARLYRSQLMGLQADVILVFAIPRDFVRPIRVSLIRSSASFPKRPPRLALATAFEGAQIELFRRTRWGLLEPAPITHADSPDVPLSQAVRENVLELVELKRHMNGESRMLVVLSPVLASSPADGPTGEIENSLRANGIAYVNLGQTIKAEETMYVDRVHFSREGHERVGRALAHSLKEGSPTSPLAE